MRLILLDSSFVRPGEVEHSIIKARLSPVPSDTGNISVCIKIF